MSFNSMASDYKETISILEKNIEKANAELEKTSGLEFRRKLFDKILHLENVLAENVEVYHYIINYYNKNSTMKPWI